MPVAVSSSHKRDKKFFYTLCHWLNGWEGVKNGTSQKTYLMQKKDLNLQDYG